MNSLDIFHFKFLSSDVTWPSFSFLPPPKNTFKSFARRALFEVHVARRKRSEKRLFEAGRKREHVSVASSHVNARPPRNAVSPKATERGENPAVAHYALLGDVGIVISLGAFFRINKKFNFCRLLFEIPLSNDSKVMLFVRHHIENNFCGGYSNIICDSFIVQNMPWYNLHHRMDKDRPIFVN